MDEETLKGIFSDINSREGTKGETGTGLGLKICAEFIKANGGTIQAESTPGKGTQFKITFQEHHVVQHEIV